MSCPGKESPWACKLEPRQVRRGGAWLLVLQAAVLSGLEQYRRQSRVVTVVQRLWDLKQGDVRLG